MRDKFNEQLEQLNVELIRMGALCEEGISAAISAATKALLDQDDDLRESAMAAEREIDQKERDIENLCMKLLLQQQPVASDLRAISAALKMISDMERIGDQAADIAEITRFIADSPLTSRVSIAGPLRRWPAASSAWSPTALTPMCAKTWSWPRAWSGRTTRSTSCS